MLKKTTYLTHSYETPDGHTLAVYERQGGYQSAKKALGMSRDAVIDEVKKAHIRGRACRARNEGKSLIFQPYDRLVKICSRRALQRLNRGCAALLRRWCTELSTKCVDKEISLMGISLCLTFLCRS